MGEAAAGSISQLGNSEILNKRKIALICSVKCPGSVILQTYDLMRSIRNEPITVISGFHSPMERECLNILLRGPSAGSGCGIVICLARSIPKRIPSEFRKPIDDGRMLLISAFSEKQTRATSETSVERNRLVAAISDVVLVPYAAAGGKAEALCREIIGRGHCVCTLSGERSAALVALGAGIVASQDYRVLLGNGSAAQAAGPPRS